MKKLVAYFSATGTTKQLAERLAGAIGADVFEIVPSELYTSEDLDWTKKDSRSTIEMTHQNLRPKVASKITNIDEYDTIFLGFPIWWYVAPTIVNTFLEQYDFTGKKIIPFATSGSSDMGNTNKNLEPSCKGAMLVEGKRFLPSASVDELKSWSEKY